MENKTRELYSVKKNYTGSLSLTLPSFDASSEPRTFRMDSTIDTIIIPRTYALGILISESATKLYEENYFTIEPADEFKKDCDSLFGSVEQVDIPTKKELMKYLQGGNRKTIKELAETSPVVREAIIAAINENIDVIPNSMIKDMGNYFGMSFIIEED